MGFIGLYGIQGVGFHVIGFYRVLNPEKVSRTGFHIGFIGFQRFLFRGRSFVSPLSKGPYTASQG